MTWNSKHLSWCALDVLFQENEQDVADRQWYMWGPFAYDTLTQFKWRHELVWKKIMLKLKLDALEKVLENVAILW